MTTALLFSSSSATFSHPNPKPSYPLRSRFTPPSISVFRPRRTFLFRRAVVAGSNALSVAVGFQVLTGSNGSDVSTREDLLDISKLGISEEIVSALSRRGITELFPIQRAVLEPAMEGRDMIGRAITGSGKTLAFGIPILDKIIQQQNQNKKKRFSSVPSALVLAPTRELARQVQREFQESAPNLSSTCLYGGVPIINQVRMLRSGIDIVVGTPGRIIDLVERGALNLSEVRFVVLDEADQMLAIGFQEDVECILSYLPAKRQSMLFSATMPSWINDLSRKYLKDPLVIDLVGESEQKLAGGITLYSIPSTASGKQNLLPSLISRYGKAGKSIIFTKTRKDAEELSRSMANIVGSKALHGNMQQLQRDRTLAAFSNGRFSVLVATDVAARGLDIPNVDLVIHFEMPNTSEMFVHRSGRTGRAGKKGTTVLIFTESQRRAVRFIERDLGCKFDELPRSNAVEDFVDRKGSRFGGYDNSRTRQSSLHGGYDNSRMRQSALLGGYDNSRMRQSASPRMFGARENHYAPSQRTQMRKYDDFEEDYDIGEGAFLSGINHLGRPSRSGAPKYPTGSESDASGRSSRSRTNYGMPKRQSSSGSGTDDFDEILDFFRDQY